MHARRHQGRDLEGRGVARPAGDQLPLRRRADDGRQPRRLQERRQGDRLPERLLDHLHGEAVRGLDRQLVPHPLVALPRRRAGVRDDEALFGRWLAGQIACFEELAVFLAPTINSYKRYAAGSWAPTTLAWGNDNRTCGFRVVGHGAARRVETRIPGGDVNPYLAFAAMIAAGLHGIEQELEPPPRARGQRLRVGRASASRRRCARRSPRSRSGTMARARLRRPGRRPLPQLRAHRAGALRPLRHRLGARSGYFERG